MRLRLRFINCIQLAVQSVWNLVVLSKFHCGNTSIEIHTTRVSDLRNRCVWTALRVHSRLRFITQLQSWLRLRFLSVGWIGIAIAIARMSPQPILEPNGNRSRSRVINVRCKGSFTRDDYFWMRLRFFTCNFVKSFTWAMGVDVICYVYILESHIASSQNRYETQSCAT